MTKEKNETPNTKQLDVNFYHIKQEELEGVTPDIPVDPPLDLIKKILGETPSQIEFLEIKAAELKKKIQDLRLVIKMKKASVELEKSKIRKEEMEKYQKELKAFYKDQKEFFMEPKKVKMTGAVAIELLKGNRPEKPTKNDLDDLANIKTNPILMEVFNYEKKLNMLEEAYELILSKVKRFENKNLNTKAHVRIFEKNIPN